MDHSSTFDRLVDQSSLLTLTAVSVAILFVCFVEAFIDLRNPSSNPLNNLFSLTAAAAFRLSIFLAIAVLSLELAPSVALVEISIAVFNAVVWQFTLPAARPLKIFYKNIILRADRAPQLVDPLFSAKRDALIRNSNIRTIGRLAQQIVRDFSNETIRAAFQEELEGRVAEGRTDAYADMLLRRLSWREVTKLVPGLEGLTVARLREAEHLLKKGLASIGDDKITFGDIRAYLDGLAEAESNKPGRLKWKRPRSWSDGRTRLFALRALWAQVGSDNFLAALRQVPGSRERLLSTASGTAVGTQVSQSRKQAPWTPSLKLAGLEIENIRCFGSVSIDFSDDSGARHWTLLLGDNGLGKSTVLRCVAMATCDQSAATALMKSLPGDILRRDADSGTILAKFSLDDDPEFEGWCRTTISTNPDGAVVLTQERSPNFPLERLFVTGYGAMRSGFGTQDYRGYTPADAVRTLFDPASSLQNPELALRRMESSGEDLGQIRDRLENLLVLSEGSIEITASGIAVQGPWGTFVPAGAIGDGYLATLAWATDLLGWAFLFSSASLTQDISGIVLLDEIEKHLHPRWQRQIIAQLNRQFPSLQFIVTTHSPLCAGGLADLSDRSGTMFRMRRSDSGEIAAEEVDLPAGMRYDQIVMSEAFGLPSARSEETSNIVEALRRAQDAGDEPKASELRKALEARSISVAEDERDRAVRERFVSLLEALRRSEDGPS